MKCLCGYEYLESWELNERLKDDINFKNGDEEFLQMSGDHNFSDEHTPLFSNGSPKTVYACPKCGTLKIEIY